MSKSNKKTSLEGLRLEKEGVYKEEGISYKMVESRIKHIQGKILTLLEGTLTNERQLNSIKSLTKSIFSENLTQFHNNVFPNCKMLTEGDMCDFAGSVNEFYEENAGIQPIN